MCIVKDCGKRGYYSINKYSEGLYCNNHKSVGMYNKRYPCCKSVGCEKNAVYSYKNNPYYMYCENHKLENMYHYSRKNRVCLYEDCNILKEYKSSYCIMHKYLKKPLKRELKKSKKINYDKLEAFLGSI